jgi:hypothetical protein
MRHRGGECYSSFVRVSRQSRDDDVISIPRLLRDAIKEDLSPERRGRGRGWIPVDGGRASMRKLICGLLKIQDLKVKVTS